MAGPLKIRWSFTFDDDCYRKVTTGINAGDVRTATIAGCARSVIEIWQTKGRIGRERQAGTGTIFYHQNRCYWTRVWHQSSMRLLRDFQAWVENYGCCVTSSAEQYLGGCVPIKSCVEREECSNLNSGSLKASNVHAPLDYTKPESHNWDVWENEFLSHRQSQLSNRRHRTCLTT